MGEANRKELLRIAAEFETLADDIERASKSPRPGKQTAV
jgi:uncharacterized protein YdcH (DUF465 family)